MRTWQKRAVGALAGMLVAGGSVAVGQAPSSASEGVVYVPEGWIDSAGRSSSIGQGGRKVTGFNASRFDYVTVDVWRGGASIYHRTVPHGTDDWIDYPGWADATVTRWRDCLSRCEVAGSYKFSAGDNPNGYLSPAVYPLLPRP
jgi:hypothetical protein